jgi:hypothetical protein
MKLDFGADGDVLPLLEDLTCAVDVTADQVLEES